MICELTPVYDSRKSFYRKAIVETNSNNETILYSYGHKVVKIKDGKVNLFDLWNASNTTLRHTKEFLKQSGFVVNSIKDIRNLIESGEFICK